MVIHLENCRLLKGHDNLTPPKERAIAVNPKMLFFIREHIRVSKALNKHDKRVLWLLCTFMWAGSFRIGELLAPTAKGFVERQTLLGRRLFIKKGLVGGVMREFLVVRLLDPKETRAKGKGQVDIEMFSLEAFYDPVGALVKFRERAVFPIDPDLPVFRWSSGTNITAQAFNRYGGFKLRTENVMTSVRFLREALLDFPGYPRDLGVTSHCFRAGVTTMLGQMGADPDLIKSVGRWSSEAWKSYCRSGRSTRLEDHLLIHRMVANFKGFTSVQLMESGEGQE